MPLRKFSSRLAKLGLWALALWATSCSQIGGPGLPFGGDGEGLGDESTFSDQAELSSQARGDADPIFQDDPKKRHYYEVVGGERCDGKLVFRRKLIATEGWAIGTFTCPTTGFPDNLEMRNLSVIPKLLAADPYVAIFENRLFEAAVVADYPTLPDLSTYGNIDHYCVTHLPPSSSTSKETIRSFTVSIRSFGSIKKAEIFIAIGPPDVDGANLGMISNKYRRVIKPFLVSSDLTAEGTRYRGPSGLDLLARPTEEISRISVRIEGIPFNDLSTSCYTNQGTSP